MALTVRKEQVVLGGTVIVLALMVWQAGPAQAGDRRRSSRRSSGGELEFEHYPAPNKSLALAEDRDEPSDRDLFSPPRDTRPLPPLELAQPPLGRPSALRPPPQPPIAPNTFGRFLRADPTPEHVPGLFAAEDGGEEDQEDFATAADPDATVDDPGATALDHLRALGDLDRPSHEELTPEQRAALVESWKKSHDWIRIHEGDPLFGQIRNDDRFGLVSRPKEAILFVQVDPDSGAEKFPGQVPVPFERERVLDFGFADTASNYIQLRKRDFAGEITPSLYADLIFFASDCVALRLEAREALRVAEEMFTKASAFDPADPIPQIGLARCYEAGFELEKAYETYLGLLESFPHRAEVHTGLALLEARLRLYDSAEARMRQALRIGRASFLVQWAIGGFLLERGRYEEAAEHLREAYRYEPKEPSAQRVRSEARSELAAALMGMGEIDDAYSFFDRALQADETNQLALAGKLGAASLGASGGGADDFEGDAGFDLLMIRALNALAAGDAEAARDGLLLAARTDPLQAHVAWRALSWLAEKTGYPEEAFGWIEDAYEADPTDAWTLYQRGRLLAARDDTEGAFQSFKAALDQELFFVDVIVSLGELAYRTGDHEDAELFLERGLSLDPERAEIHALRGVNLLALNDPRTAEEAFRASLDIEDSQPLALVGLAWVSYLRGDSERAITQLAELNDRRRSLPDDDPYRVFAKAQMERIADHEEKEIWSDRFERRQLKRGWDVEEAAGPEVYLENGELVVRGNFKQNARTRFWRELSAPDFVSIEMDVTVMADNNARVGVFLSKERRRGAGEIEVQSRVAAAREKTGGLAVLMEDTVKADPEWEDVAEVGAPWWPAGRKVRVGIEKVGEGSDAYGRITIDGVIVREGFKVRQLSTSSSKVKVGLFVESQTGLPAHVVVDDVEMVYRVRS